MVLSNSNTGVHTSKNLTTFEGDAIGMSSLENKNHFVSINQKEIKVFSCINIFIINDTVHINKNDVRPFPLLFCFAVTNAAAENTNAALEDP